MTGVVQFEQVAPALGKAGQTPEAGQLKVAAPVVPLVELMVELTVDSGVNGAGPEQVFVPTVQVKVCTGH